MSICHVQTIFSYLSPNPKLNQSFDHRNAFTYGCLNQDLHLITLVLTRQSPLLRGHMDTVHCHLCLLNLLVDIRSTQLQMTSDCQTSIITVICIALQ